MDNSFLVEEAYNQEPGVVQHIMTAFYGIDRLPGPDDKTLNLAFTQEWPIVSQTHQFSYTVPYNFARSGGQSSDGIASTRSQSTVCRSIRGVVPVLNRPNRIPSRWYINRKRPLRR